MTIHDLTTYAGQYAHIKAVKARIASAAYRPKKPKIETVKTFKVKQSEYWDIPLWKAHRIQFNDHIIRWQMRSFSTNTDWLRDRCRELGVDYGDIVSASRARPLAKVRQRLMYETHMRFPELSLPQLGRMFGGRDHTTLIHGIRAHKERMNANDI